MSKFISFFMYFRNYTIGETDNYYKVRALYLLLTRGEWWKHCLKIWRLLLCECLQHGLLFWEIYLKKKQELHIEYSVFFIVCFGTFLLIPINNDWSNSTIKCQKNKHITSVECAMTSVSIQLYNWWNEFFHSIYILLYLDFVLYSKWVL